ncbi:RNA-binding protein [Candidatus Woesearchaeota archaeon]|nr:RNA-binding protein [Candidatus Woesearchaeota archaeon]
MTEKQAVCSSCKKRISNTIGSTRFMCPRCAKVEVVRCNHCRQIAAKYKCNSCDFEGPN